MRRDALSTGLWLVAIFTTLATGTVQAADLVWQVENPFRFFKSTHSFALHEAAFNAARGSSVTVTSAPTLASARSAERRLPDP